MLCGWCGLPYSSTKHPVGCWGQDDYRGEPLRPLTEFFEPLDPTDPFGPDELITSTGMPLTSGHQDPPLHLRILK